MPGVYHCDVVFTGQPMIDNDVDGLVNEDPAEIEIDNDLDGLFSEDPIDGSDNDLDTLVDEDPSEQVDNDLDGLFSEDPVEAPVIIGTQTIWLEVIGSKGYWNHHEDETVSLLPKTLGGYSVDDFIEAQGVFDAASAKNAVNMLAAQLLAAKLNLMAGADGSCLGTTIAAADAILTAQGYDGPGTGTPLTKSAKTAANAASSTLDSFNNIGC